MMRLDAYLVQEQMAQSRSRARALIEAGKVLVDGVPCTKASATLEPNAVVLLAEPDHPYVSRAALKLKGLLDHLSLRFDGKIVLDVGASTGGFTQVALEYGAQKVFAVDVGTDQLAPLLRSDSRVVVMEQTDGRKLPPLNPAPQVLVSDVSFISQTKVLPAVLASQPALHTLCILVKPQFELEPKDVGKGGLVKSAEARERACNRVRTCVQDLGFTMRYFAPSTLVGADGNQEFVLYAVKE